MKIIIVNDQFEPRTNGSVMTAYRFANALQEKGHEVKILGIGAESENNIQACSVQEKYVPILTEVCHLNQTYLAKYDEEKVKDFFNGADIVHFIYPFHFEKKCKKLADSMGIATTSAFHVQPENITYNCYMSWLEPLNQFIYHHFEWRFYHLFHRIHCPSQMIANQLKKHGYKQKLYVISNGYDPDFKPKEEEKKQDDFFHLMMVGRLAPEKKQKIIIKAIGKSKYNDKIILTLAGNGPEKEYYEKLGKKVMKNPIVFGFYKKDQLITELNKQDLYVHAAVAEIEGISCIEAIACGLVPIIANSKKSAAPQFALDERSLFKKNNVKELAEKIDYWIEHTAERKEMEPRYAKHALNFSLNASIEKAEKMFMEEIQENKAENKK